METPALGRAVQGKPSMVLCQCGSVVPLMKAMQQPDMLSARCGSREILWCGGSEILSVGNCFSTTELLLRRKERSTSV